jgi:hypothetical protein
MTLEGPTRQVYGEGACQFHVADHMFSCMEAIPQPYQAVVELFASSLPDVRFGDIDAQTLAKLAADVQVAAEQMLLAQAALDEARLALKRRQEDLGHHVQRAWAYARVYSENDEALSAQLRAISLPRQARRTPAEALVLSPDPEPAQVPRKRSRQRTHDEPPREAPLVAESTFDEVG